jgi:hypothetical protein
VQYASYTYSLPSTEVAGIFAMSRRSTFKSMKG